MVEAVPIGDRPVGHATADEVKLIVGPPLRPLLCDIYGEYFIGQKVSPSIP